MTKEIETQLISREELRQTPEVHVAGLCFKHYQGQLHALIARRNSNRSLFPNLYEGCGGQLQRSETFSSGVKRHYKLEFGLEVAPVEDCHRFYYIQQPNEPIIPGIKFLCEFIEGRPQSENHSELRWVTHDELKLIGEEEFIPGLKTDFEEFFQEAADRL